MSAISRLVLNLSIAAKLGIASGLSILLVFAMMITQSQGNIEIRDADARKFITKGFAMPETEYDDPQTKNLGRQVLKELR